MPTTTIRNSSAFFSLVMLTLANVTLYIVLLIDGVALAVRARPVVSKKMYTGSEDNLEVSFKKAFDDLVENASTREYFKDRAPTHLRSRWDVLRKKHQAYEREGGKTGSSIPEPSSAEDREIVSDRKILMYSSS